MFEIIKKFFYFTPDIIYEFQLSFDTCCTGFTSWHVEQIKTLQVTASNSMHWKSQLNDSVCSQSGLRTREDCQCRSCKRRERSQAGERHAAFAKGCWHTHENCMHAKQTITIFYICFFYYHLVLFSIVLCSTIVTVSFQCPR